MPNTDFRVTTDALDHPKLVKLEGVCGEHGVLCLLRLWSFTARYHPKGKLNGMTAKDVEIAARWRGELGEFFATLRELKLIDEKGHSLTIHGWKEHNSYAYYAPERSARARHAVKVREDRKRASRSSGGSSPRSSPSPPPSPSPNPSPSPKETDLAPTGTPAPETSSGKSQGAEKPAKEKKPYKPLRLRKAKTPVGRARRYWHTEYYRVHGEDYAGDIKVISGQIGQLVRQGHQWLHICAAMCAFLSADSDKYTNFHNFNTFIRGYSKWSAKATEEGIVIEPADDDEIPGEENQ